jgi:hypothetical protein
LSQGKREVVHMTRRDDAQSGHAVVPGLASEKGRKSEEERGLSLPKQATTVDLSEQEEQGLLKVTRRHRA